MTKDELRAIYDRMSSGLRKRVSAETIAVIHDQYVGTTPGPSLRNRGGAIEVLNPYAPYKNKWEMRYAERLEVLKLLGEVVESEYEPEPIIAAGGTKYTPDFKVTFAAGGIEYHEVKGHYRDRDKVRVRECAVASQYPIVLWSMKGGAWHVLRTYLPVGEG